MSNSIHVTGIGNAIVDKIAFVDDAFIKGLGIEKGKMHLIDYTQADTLRTSINIEKKCSGGSVANSIAAVSLSGLPAAFIGKVAHDEAGKHFEEDLIATGSIYQTVKQPHGTSAESYILVTPDAERTMCTYLGDAIALTNEDIDQLLISQSNILYIEGYLWDSDQQSALINQVIDIAKEHGVKVAFSYSDPFCVTRHQKDFRELLKRVDLIFANEDEIKALFDTDDFETIEKLLLETNTITCMTKGADGAYIFDQETHFVPSQTVSNVVDTTGAGDHFAAGFLYGFSQGFDVTNSAKIGHEYAARIITQVGARHNQANSNILTNE